MPKYQTAYTVDGMEGILEMVQEERDLASKGLTAKTQAERDRAETVGAVLERLHGKLARTSIHGLLDV